MKKITVLLTLFLVAIISGCSSDDSSSSAGGSTITLRMNDVDITATVTSARLIKSAGSNEKLLEIIAENSKYKFSINYFSTYSADDAIPLGNYVYNDADVEGYVNVSYKLNGNTYGMHFPELGSLNITSMNSSGKKVTGTFSQTLTGGGELDGEETPTELVITNGVFSNLSYTVFNL